PPATPTHAEALAPAAPAPPRSTPASPGMITPSKTWRRYTTGCGHTATAANPRLRAAAQPRPSASRDGVRRSHTPDSSDQDQHDQDQHHGSAGRLHPNPQAAQQTARHTPRHLLTAPPP